MPNKLSARSLNYTSILVIERKTFVEVLKNFKADYETFCEIKDKMNMYQDYQDLNLKCYSNYYFQTKFIKKKKFKKVQSLIDLLSNNIK